MNKLIDFCERLPPQACIFSARIGSSQSLNIIFKAVLVPVWEEVTGLSFINDYKPHPKDTLETFAYMDMNDLVEECLQTCEDEGWGSEHDTVRFHAFTSDIKPIKSKVLKKELFVEVDKQTDTVQALTNGLLRMSEEIRRSMREITNNNKEHLQTIAQLSNSNVEKNRHVLELERENMARELIMELYDKENDENTQEQSQSLMDKVIGLIQQQIHASNVDIDTMVKETIKSDPEKVKEYMQDEEVVEAVKKAMMEKMKEDMENHDI